MYNGVIASVRTLEGETNSFSIAMCLHQGSGLSPYLFAIVINLIKHIQDEVPWCMLFVDGIVLLMRLELE